MRLSARLYLSFCSICLLCVLPLVSFADPDPKPKGDAGSSPADKADAEAKPKSPVKNKPAVDKAGSKNAEITAEREQTALAFAAEHHPELVGLITPLKTSNPKEYQRAVRELFRTNERLAGIRLKDKVRYELELDAWKLQSQVRLLTARLTMETDSELEANLRAALQKKSENQLKLYKNERETLQSRVEQLEKQIDRLSDSQDKLVQQEYDRLLQKASREKKSVAAKPNPGKPVTNNKKNNPAKAGAVKSSSTTSADK